MGRFLSCGHGHIHVASLLTNHLRPALGAFLLVVRLTRHMRSLMSTRGAHAFSAGTRLGTAAHAPTALPAPRTATAFSRTCSISSWHIGLLSYHFLFGIRVSDAGYVDSRLAAGGRNNQA
jgi:hypothetical protein